MCDPAQTGWPAACRRGLGRLGWLAACLLASSVLSAGCNPLAIGYTMFLMNPNSPPDKVDFTQKKSNPKVAIMVFHANAQTQANTDTAMADRLLAMRLHQMLAKLYKDSRSGVQLVPMSKVQDYQAKHTDWRLKSLRDLGKALDADFVVSLEINKMSLYEDPRTQQLYRGHAEMEVAVADCDGAEENIIPNLPYVCEYPGLGGVPVDEPLNAFRDKFVNKIARDLSRWFAPTPPETRYDFD